MKRYFFFIFGITISFCTRSQPNMLYEINDYVPSRFINPRLVLGDTTNSKQIYYYVSKLGFSYDFYDDLGSPANNFNFSIWSSNSLYYKKFQFSFKPTYYPLDNLYGLNTDKGIDIDNDYDKLKAGSINQSEFRPKIQIGYLPSKSVDIISDFAPRFQASWTPIYSRGNFTNEFELTFGFKGTNRNRKGFRMNSFAQYYLTINPDFNLFSYGYFASSTICYLGKNNSLNYVVNYNRYNHAGVDKNGFIYLGFSTEVNTVLDSKIYLEVAYAYDYHYEYQLIHFGGYFQLPLIRQYIVR